MFLRLSHKWEKEPLLFIIKEAQEMLQSFWWRENFLYSCGA